MTTSPTAVQSPAELPENIAWAASEIEERLRTKSVEAVYRIGERTGWWNDALVDWVFDGRQGPPPSSSTPPPLSLRQEQDQRLEELQHELADRGVVDEEAPTSEEADEAAREALAGVIDEPAVRAQFLADTEPAVGTLAEQPRVVEPMTSEEAAAEIARVESAHASGGADRAMTVAASAYITVLQGRELGVDHSYQRPLDEPRVKRMAANWDPRMVGTIDVSDRGEGETPRYAVINGQHRAAAAARHSPAGADVWLPCTVHEGLTVAQEAALMHELDRTTKKLSGWDKWRARRGAGDVAVLTVDRVAARHGLRVDDAIADGAMRSYGTAEKLLQLGGEQLLDNAIAVLKAAYGDAAAAYQAPLLMGVGQLLHRYPDLDVERLRAALAKARPEQLRASATALRDFEDGPLHQLMAMAIATAYNRAPGSGPRISGGR